MVGNTWCHLVPCARLSSRRGEVGPGWLWACTVDGIRLEFGGSSCSANLSVLQGVAKQLAPEECGQGVDVWIPPTIAAHHIYCQVFSLCSLCMSKPVMLLLEQRAINCSPLQVQTAALCLTH